MLRPRTPFHLAALSAAFVVALGFSQPAAAAPSCSYSAGTVTAMLGAGDAATLEVTAGGQIRLVAPLVACGAATTGNTDLIHVDGHVGSTESLTIDQSNGLLGPGMEVESGPGEISEIEVEVNLGDASDKVVVRGSPDQTGLAVGLKGVAFDDDHDVDITFSPRPSSIELVAANGIPHVLSARGGFGSGRVFPGRVTLRGGDKADDLTGSDFADLLIGGNGNDFIFGAAGADVINGGGGQDKLRGAGGDDSLTGGPGPDIFSGSYGDDVLDAHDGVADLQLNGGPGVDTAAYDRGLDPKPNAVENRFPLGLPTPPPPNPEPVTGCTYDSADQVVTATIAPGKRATLAVRQGRIRFGAPAVDCGIATRSNTDRIVVQGSTDTREKLVIDLRGGKLAPGFTHEATGGSEIEVRVQLHDVVDLVRVIGPRSRGFVTVGRRGISLNKDRDVDVTVKPSPIMVSVVGGKKRDRLSAAGGRGTGHAFVGSVELKGGAAADVLIGGNGIDTLVGGAGNDRLVGGRRPDLLSGGAGRDVLLAVDRRADRRVNGGAGRDKAYYDRGRDRPVACEVLRPRG